MKNQGNIEGCPGLIQRLAGRLRLRWDRPRWEETRKEVFGGPELSQNLSKSLLSLRSPPRRSVRGLASLTMIRRPSKSVPFNLVLAS